MRHIRPDIEKPVVPEALQETAMAEKSTVLIIDEHPLFREGVKSIFRDDAKYGIVGEATNAAEARRKAAELKPDIVLLELALPDGRGFDLIKEIKKTAPNSAIIVLTMHTKVNKIVEAFKAGAIAYLIKDSPLEFFMQAMNSASKGEYFMDPAISDKIVSELVKEPEKERNIVNGNLTRREREIIVLLAEGDRPKQIAEKLYISRKTVENHRYNVMRKLGLHSTHDLVKYAVKSGLIDIEMWH